MYLNIVGITLIKSLRPYFRKYVLGSLGVFEFFLLNSFMIVFILTVVLLYLILTKEINFQNICNKYYELSFFQSVCIMIIATFTVCSGMMMLHLDKNYNTPIINKVLVNVFSVILLFVVGIFMFKEKYKFSQFIGLILTILGIYLITNENNNVFV